MIDGSWCLYLYSATYEGRDKFHVFLPWTRQGGFFNPKVRSYGRLKLKRYDSREEAESILKERE